MKICIFIFSILLMNISAHQKTISILVFSLTVTLFLFSCQKNEGDPPDAGFNFNSIATVPATYQFVNTSISTGGPSTFAWDFGDGSTSTVVSPSHTYDAPGIYAVRLVQIPSAGFNDTLVMILNLGIASGPNGTSIRLYSPQTASFQFAISSRAYRFTFTNTSTDAESYLWNFGDGTTTTTDSTTVVHTYATGGNYNVTLTATNGNGSNTATAVLDF